MNEICKNCTWWVEETENIGEYEHSEALKQNKGFCLVQDLFTHKEPDDECDCGEYNEQKLQKDANSKRQRQKKSNIANDKQIKK